MVAVDVDRHVEPTRQAGAGFTPEYSCRLEQQPAGCHREYCGRQHSDLGLVLERLVVEGEFDDQQRDGEADARQRRPADHLALTDAPWKPTEAGTHGSERSSRYPEQLADHEAGDDAPGER